MSKAEGHPNAPGNASDAASNRQRRDPLDAVPAVPEQVEHRQDDAGLIQVRLTLKEKPGLKEYFARRLGFRRAIQANLDERGSFFWKRIDGKRKLAEIEKDLRRNFDLTEDESRQATVMFTKMLMVRGLICLHVPIKQNEDGTGH